MSPADPAPAGLRERKKARTRAAIQTCALRLFREQGYEATTVRQVIEEAEVSESTFFRYFPAKADLVLTDEFDPVIVEAFLRQPAELSAIRALRTAFAETFSRLTPDQEREQQERMALVAAVPELRAAMYDQFVQPLTLVAGAVAERTGRPPRDPAVLALAGAVIGAAVAVMLGAADDPTASIAALFDEAMAHLEEGLVL